MSSKVKKEFEHKASSSSKVVPRRSRDEDEDAGDEGSNHNQSYKKSKGNTAPPSKYENFEDNDNGVTLQLLVKNTKGETLHTSNLQKKEFSTGSFGWNLADKVTVDNGEGGTMIVSLNGNCVIQGSKKNRKR